MRICILGGGNVGTLLLGELGTKTNVSVSLLTSAPERWRYNIEVYEPDDSLKCAGNVGKISKNPEDVITDADIILATVPSHVFSEKIQRIRPFIKKNAWIGVMPGTGGCEFYCKDLVSDGCTFFGFQRVHGIARIKEYGKSVYDLGKKRGLHIAAIPAFKTGHICSVIADLLGISCYELTNYLNVTLTPSNPLLHTTRLYTMFKDYEEGMYWNNVIAFYREWTDKTSKMLIACDDELQALCENMRGLDLTGVRSLKEHYESENPKQMTKKIASIEAFKKIEAPMVKTGKGYIPDFNSRYFKEDFPYGLCIIKSFCNVISLETPAIDKVLRWFQRIAGKHYYVGSNFTGKDLDTLPLPQNYGLNSLEEIVSYYK